MSKLEKLIDKLLARPSDFTWSELLTLLKGLGYKQLKIGKTGGSRARFIHIDYPTIIMHRPHPGRELKRYQVDYLLDLLSREELL